MIIRHTKHSPKNCLIAHYVERLYHLPRNITSHTYSITIIKMTKQIPSFLIIPKFSPPIGHLVNDPVGRFTFSPQSSFWLGIGDASMVGFPPPPPAKTNMASWENSPFEIRCIPRCSMYGIVTYIWVILMVHVGKCTIHGASGIYIYIVFYWNMKIFQLAMLVCRECCEL